MFVDSFCVATVAPPLSATARCDGGATLVGKPGIATVIGCDIRFRSKSRQFHYPPTAAWASFHQPHLLPRRCVVVVRNLTHVDLRITVVRSRGKPLDLEVSELERGTLESFENPEILEGVSRSKCWRIVIDENSGLKLYSFHRSVPSRGYSIAKCC